MNEKTMTAQEKRMWREADLDRFRRDHPGPVTLKLLLNLGRPDAERLGFDRDNPPQQGDVVTVEDPDVAFEMLRRGWAAEVETTGADGE